MFTFNDIDFSTLNIKITADGIKRPLFAPQKLSTTALEGKDEEIFHRKTSSSYNIEVEFYLFSNTGLELISDLRDLAGMLDTDGPAKLIFHDEDDKYVKAIVEDADIERHGRYAIVNVSFKVLDPFWYAESDDTFTYTTTGTKPITRKGNAQSYPYIEIEGVSSTSGSFTIGANGVNMKYTGALVAGQKLVVDSSLLTVYAIGVSGENRLSMLNKMDVLDFPVFSKGDNNFTIAVGGGATLTKCTVKCNSRWK